MTGQLTISLAPSGAIRLHLPHHTVELPASIAGLKVLQLILMEHSAAEAAQLGTAANPTQHNIDSWLKSSDGQRALQLAGEVKRWKETQTRTGVTTRRAQEPERSKPKAPPPGLTLEQLMSWPD